MKYTFTFIHKITKKEVNIDANSLDMAIDSFQISTKENYMLYDITFEKKKK